MNTETNQKHAAEINTLIRVQNLIQQDKFATGYQSVGQYRHALQVILQHEINKLKPLVVVGDGSGTTLPECSQVEKTSEPPEPRIIIEGVSVFKSKSEFDIYAKKSPSMKFLSFFRFKE